MAAQEKLLRRCGVAAESRFVEVPAIKGRAHVLVTGQGPPVVMVPGFADPAAMWAPLMAQLDEFTLHAVDRPCFGLTDSAPLSTGTFRTLAVGFLEQVLDALGLEQPVFVGNSIGSLWTFWMALDRPGRVAGMAHLGCPAFLLGTSAPLPMRLLSFRPLGQLMMKMARPSARQVENFASMVRVDLSGLPELRDLLVEAQKLPGAGPAILDLLHSVVRLRGARPDVALTGEQIERISQPVQLIWGERDPFGGPEIGTNAAAKIAHAEFHVVSDAGHVPWVAHEKETGELVAQFLRRSCSPQR